MKLLLTSAGISNDSIKKALFDLVSKRPRETSLAFIPTASNVEKGDKRWVIKDLLTLKELNLQSISIVDISAVDRNIWEPQLQKADILFFEGGNTFHLMEWVSKSGLAALLPEFLKTKVYVGISAGSMIVSPDLILNILQKLYEEDLEKTENLSGLNFVDFYALPHYNSPHFYLRNKEGVLSATKDIKKKIYVLDDMSAVKVDNGDVKIISEGQFLELN
ncbi:MAG: Type 1 glutamine amidotransferase-like domain-containing protein [Patescibacteria group bacterium]|jgi:dipeptidase E